MVEPSGATDATMTMGALYVAVGYISERGTPFRAAQEVVSILVK